MTPASWGYDPVSDRWVLARWQDATAAIPARLPAGALAELVDDELVLGSYPVDALAATAPGGRQTISLSVQQQTGKALPACAFDGAPGAWRSMTCPVCWSVSFTADDARERYCGRCCWPTGDPTAGPRPVSEVP